MTRNGCPYCDTTMYTEKKEGRDGQRYTHVQCPYDRCVGTSYIMGVG